MIPRPTEKWRPTLAMVVVMVLLAVLALPLGGLALFRLYENQLIRQTEGELIGQSAVLAAVMAREAGARTGGTLPLGAELPEDTLPKLGEIYQPVIPQLDLNTATMRPPRPDARPPAAAAHAEYLAIGELMTPLLQETQRLTLAGFRVLDPTGTVVAGRSDMGLSLSHVHEVAVALKGRYASVLRERISDEPAPPLQSISRGTQVRVFTALPVVYGNRVAGVIYASRTPNNILRELYQQRRNVALAAIFVIAMTAIIAFIFIRTITGPVRELIKRTARIGRGERDAIRPLKRHGSREIANLSQSFLEMASKLYERTDYIANFAAHVSHELKSPLTSIQGAAELLRDAQGSMTEAEKQKFLDNIICDTERLTVLVDRMRELARADNPQTGGACDLERIVGEVRQAHLDMKIELQQSAPGIAYPMSEENARIVLKHLFENAAEHAAERVGLQLETSGNTVVLEIRDDGQGISEQNAERIFDTFFTTKRESGGTGMGLGIVRSMLRAHGGSIELKESDSGACFEVRLPGRG